MIILNKAEQIGKAHQNVFVTLDEVAGQENIQFTHAAPSGLDGEQLQNYIERKELSYKLDVIRDMFPTLRLNRDYVIDPGQSQLEAIEGWISEGRMLRDDEGQYTEQLDPMPWVSTHPESARILDGMKLSEETETLLDDANTSAKLQTVIKRIISGV